MASDNQTFNAAMQNSQQGSHRVGFVLLSTPDRPIPSTRIAALNVMHGLASAGFEPAVLYAPSPANEMPDPPLSATQIVREGTEVVVFQKVRGPKVLQLAQALEAEGVRTVFLVCDVVDPDMCAATSATVVVTDYLKALYPASLRHKVHVVHDGIEHPEVTSVPSSHDATRSNPLRAVLVTSTEMLDLPVLGVPPQWLHVTVVGDYPPASNRRLRLQRWYWALKNESRWSVRWRMLRATLCRRIRRVAWTPEAVYEEISRADVGIIPIDTSYDFCLPHQPVPAWKLKSENRLTLKMAAGLPVVATPIPSYEPVVTQGVDGFLANDRDDWLRALDALRSAQVRRLMGQAARARVVDTFSVDRQASALADVLRSLLHPKTESSGASHLDLPLHSPEAR